MTPRLAPISAVQKPRLKLPGSSLQVKALQQPQTCPVLPPEAPCGWLQAQGCCLAALHLP